MKAIKLLYLPILLLLTANVQAQNEDQCAVPTDCILFVRSEWMDMNDPEKPDVNKDLWRFTTTPLAELDSIIIKIGTGKDQGEVLNIKGKLNINDLSNVFVDFGSYGIKPINENTGYALNFDFDFKQRLDKDKFIFITVRALDLSRVKRSYLGMMISPSLAILNSPKESFRFYINADNTSKKLRIRYHLANPTNTMLEIWNSSGKLIKRLQENVLETGDIYKEYSIADQPKGIYILQATMGDNYFNEKFIIE